MTFIWHQPDLGVMSLERQIAFQKVALKNGETVRN